MADEEYQKLEAMIVNLVTKYSRLKNNALDRTKLNKLLFFSDITHIFNMQRQNVHPVSISGVNYFHFRYEIIPENYDGVLVDLKAKKYICIEEVSPIHDLSITKGTNNNDMGKLLNQSERESIKMVYDGLGKWEGWQLAKYSHNLDIYTKSKPFSRVILEKIINDPKGINIYNLFLNADKNKKRAS